MADDSLTRTPVAVVALSVRAVVLALGESTQPPWWNTNFMSETGMRFLERLYPRSSFRAAVNSAGKAACAIHDRAVGRVGVYHLFRLPATLEAAVHTVPLEADEVFVSRLRPSLGRKDELIEQLRLLSGDEEVSDAAPGPRRMGLEQDLMKARAFSKIAAAYYEAFSKGKPVYPYFTADDSRTFK